MAHINKTEWISACDLDVAYHTFLVAGQPINQNLWQVAKTMQLMWDRCEVFGRFRGQDYKEKHKLDSKTNLKHPLLNNTELRHFWAQIVSWAPRHARKTFIVLALDLFSKDSVITALRQMNIIILKSRVICFSANKNYSNWLDDKFSFDNQDILIILFCFLVASY